MAGESTTTMSDFALFALLGIPSGLFALVHFVLAAKSSRHIDKEDHLIFTGIGVVAMLPPFSVIVCGLLACFIAIGALLIVLLPVIGLARLAVGLPLIPEE